ncbi:MAG: sensor histidine kinase [Gemmatimonadota bacterium]
MPATGTDEIAAALFQATVTLGLSGLFLFLHVRYRKPHFFWWAVAWGLYALRLAAIVSFLGTGARAWLYWHQVITGWTALTMLWAALVFSRQLTWRRWYALLLLFPLVWSWIAIFALDQFLLAAGPAVAFLSATTLWTGVVFWRYRQRSGSAAAGFLAGTLILWGFHHLDYPILRARGAWNPWGYFLDSLFLLAMGAGVLLLVIEELRQGLQTMTALSGDLRPRDRADALDVLLARPLALRGVRGAAVIEPASSGPTVLRGAGACAGWSWATMPAAIRALVEHTIETGHSRLDGIVPRGEADELPALTAVLPLAGAGAPGGALLIIGDVAAPFTALDDSILVAVGAQIGAALENAELYAGLAARNADLERLSIRMIRQQDDLRRRLGRELHDETAQVFSALKLQLGSLRESAPESLGGRFDRLVGLVDVGTRSIRSVTEGLRPAVLDDLGLIPAIRALAADFRQWSGLEVEFVAPDALPAIAPGGELAAFRAVQEGLSNVARHAQAHRARVVLEPRSGGVRVTVEDDGQGAPDGDLARLAGGPGRSGLFGMRERVGAEEGTVRFEAAPGGGFRLTVELPAAGAPAR